MTATLSAEKVRAEALAAGFSLAGLARACALDPGPLEAWLGAGYGADMAFMERRQDERLDPRRVLPGARTVIALAIGYHRAGDPRSPIARYARGRDYHYAHRDRMKVLRKRLLALAPGIETYACVDTGVAMEKVWAARAGLGWIGKNACLINPRWGSWLTLSVMFVDREVDAYDERHEDRCGDCTACLGACPTKAFPTPGVVDARRCLSYQTIENHGEVPEELRPAFRGRVFGCDVCQDVCPFNRGELPEGDERFAPRPLAALRPAALAALSQDEFESLSPGTAVARAGYDGLRRNALYAIGAARDRAALPVAERLASDENALVRAAATWTRERLG